jgi:TM2 domain-containing membrane protein YozV
MFCRNCGKALTGTPEICLGCGARPLIGSSFCHACGAKTNPLAVICIKCGASLEGKVAAGDVSPKSRLATTLLAWFLGQFDAHRFYLGKIGTAIAMLFTCGGLGIWTLIDFIYAVTGNMKDKEGKLIKNW